MAYPTSRRNDNTEQSIGKVMPEVAGLMDTIWYLIKMIFGMDETGRPIESVCLAIILGVEVPRADIVKTVRQPQRMTVRGGVEMGIVGQKSTMIVVEDEDVLDSALIRTTRKPPLSAANLVNSPEKHIGGLARR